MLKKLRLVTLLTLAASQMVFAGNRPNAFSVTLGEGYYWFSQNRHVENTGMPNIALAYNFDEKWAAELGMGLINSNQTHQVRNKGVHGFLYTFDGIYRFMQHDRFEPYTSFGIGTLGLSPNGTNSPWLGNINAGVGTQWYMEKSVAFRGELRDIYTINGGFNDVMLNFGVSFLIG